MPAPGVLTQRPAPREGACAASAGRPYLGIGLKVLSALTFTLMSAGVKSLADRFPTGEIVFFRSAFAILPLLLWLGWQGGVAAAVRTRNLRGHVLRSIIGAAGMFAGFAGLSFLPLSDAVAIGYASPLLVVVLAALVLRERVQGYRWAAVVVGFVGVLIMLAPHLDLGSGGASGSVGVLFACLAAVCTAAATIQVRRLTQTERTGAIVLYFFLFTALLGLSTLVLGWRMPTLPEFGLFVLVGILGGIGQILLTESYRYGDASLVAPFEYTTMLWSLLIGWFVFGQLPQAAVALGGVIVAAAGVFTVWRERRLVLERAREAAAGGARAG
ncbi:DMT family transporter [Methylobacterium isbiliense]|jgi:drug/metabolite transporter (DMT)-like permease|uniref:Pseudopaline exporter CntI n=1 Tax=Methylobacterium isbiliense TaxID=315478 RepID=A0ABQ4SNB7_9HYPH|nr:DMT family transporter [Methylobacterium isbiliense]MDN3625313.1 DMT family transporter [Methylobacterium isbiliense]GJE03219.1 Pseudopaline exporter CntI [Methylobacterium isbiliense]